MPSLQIMLDSDGIWGDLTALYRDGRLLLAMGDAAALQVAALPGGMMSGAPSVTLRIDLPDGRVVLTETSLALFLTAADMLKARHGDPRMEDFRGRPRRQEP
jgi:hypothetical protein